MKRVIPLMIAATMIFSGCSTTSNIETANKSNTVSTASKDVYIMAGKVQSNQEVMLTSKVMGRVSNISVNIGDRVNKGDVIINLDPIDAQAQVKQAEAAVTTAQANLTMLQSGTRPEQIEQANAALQTAQANYDVAKTNFDRTTALFSSGSASRQALEAAQTQLTAAESQYKSAKEQVQMLGSGQTKEALNIAQSQVKQAQAALETAQLQLRNMVITSPISGTVSSKSINIGELASPNQSLATIINSEDLGINAYIPLNLVNQFKVGDKVSVKISEIENKKFDGEIIAIDPSVDSKSKNILVKAVVDDKDKLLRPGMFAEIGLKK